MKKHIKIEIPEEFRKGQAIFNFLEWLAVKKGVNKNQNHRLADTYYLLDKDFDKFYREYFNQYLMKKIHGKETKEN